MKGQGIRPKWSLKLKTKSFMFILRPMTACKRDNVFEMHREAGIKLDAEKLV